jgi:energy-converting hydrogenase Eha subunit B
MGWMATIANASLISIRSGSDIVRPDLAGACRMALDGWECSELSGPVTLPCVPISASARTRPVRLPLRTSPRRRRAIGDRAAQAARGEDCRYSAPKGVPVRALPWAKWSDVGPLLVGAVGIILVSLTDTIATAADFASRRGDEVDSDQEMVGVGASNIAAGFFQGFAVSVGGCRAAVVDQSGARTQLAGLVGAGLVAVLLLFLNGLLADLPQAALASVAITTALSLMDPGVSSGDTPRSAPQRSP